MKDPLISVAFNTVARAAIPYMIGHGAFYSDLMFDADSLCGLPVNDCAYIAVRTTGTTYCDGDLARWKAAHARDAAPLTVAYIRVTRPSTHVFKAEVVEETPLWATRQQEARSQ